jgi:hypothetical protein
LKAVIIKDLKKLEKFLIDIPVLIPKPKTIHRFERNDAFILTSECSISSINIENDKVLFEDLNEILDEISIIKLNKFDIEDSDKEVLDNKSEWDFLDVNNEEGYNLEIFGNRILIYSIYEKGLFYGIQTLIQLIKNVYLLDPNSRRVSKSSIDKLILPEIEIKDVPDLKIRGVAQDLSRGQVFTVENAKRYIKILSHYKMNFYCAYIEDMFAHPNHPLIGKDRGALTPEEIKEIDLFAKERNVEFVPILECFSHTDNILINKEYEDLGEFPGAQCFNISNPDIYPFINDYISEMSKAFSTEYFHIGCDESFDLGKYKSKDFIRENGKGKVLADFYNKVYDMCRENNNRHVIMYDDIVRRDEYLLEHVNKDVILMYWYYGRKKKESKIKKFVKAGYRVIVSPSMMNWQRNFPDNISSNKNIMNLIKGAYKYRNHGCLGVLTSTWGDARYYSLRENEIFGAILTGAMAWKVSDFNLIELRKNYGFLFFGINKDNIEKFNDLFTMLSSSSFYYYRFNFLKLLPPIFYTHLFKHPFSKQKYKPPFKKYKKLGDMAFKCLEKYPELESQVIFEKENFECLKFGAELAYYLKEKIDTSKRVAELLHNSEISENDIKRAEKNINSTKEKIEYLKENYEKLWLRAAKRPCLDVNLSLFDFVINCYDEKIKQIKGKDYYRDPYLPSEWIWVHETKCPHTPRYFRSIIEINQPVEKAILQGIACNHMKIHVNGEFIGEVKSRLSLSILPIINRVQTFDITKNLKKGKNIIAIEAFSYEDYKGAINIYGQIKLKNDIILEIITDKSWSSNKKEIFKNQEWLKLEFDDSKWKGVKSYGRPPKLNGDIFKPNLLEGEKSTTQDYFGINSYFSNVFDTVLGGSILRIVKPIAARLVKYLKPFGN